MQGQYVSGAFGCLTPHEQGKAARHDAGSSSLGTARIEELRREVEQQWEAVRVLREAKDAAASRALAALRRARQTERTIRELELQAASDSYSGARS